MNCDNYIRTNTTMVIHVQRFLFISCITRNMYCAFLLHAVFNSDHDVFSSFNKTFNKKYVHSKCVKVQCHDIVYMPPDVNTTSTLWYKNTLKHPNSQLSIQ